MLHLELLRTSRLTNYCCRMSFFSRGSNGRNNRGRGNWHEGHRRPQFSIHFDVDPARVEPNCFKLGSLIWLAMGYCILDLKGPLFNNLRIFLAFLFPHMCRCNPNLPQMTVGKKLSINLLLTTVVGLLSHFHYHHHHLQLILMHKFPMLFHQCSLRMPTRD
jgi:hypothetical protein